MLQQNEALKKSIRKRYRMARYIMYKETLVDIKEHIWTLIGSFVGIGLIGFLNSQHFTAYDNLFLTGSFGASAVLIYGVINSPFSQPRILSADICSLPSLVLPFTN